MSQLDQIKIFLFTKKIMDGKIHHVHVISKNSKIFLPRDKNIIVGNSIKASELFMTCIVFI